MSAAAIDVAVDALVVGAGPAGLGLATRLKASGVASVLVVDREADAGGNPRHCGHPPFGLREFGRVLTGPAYARRLAARAVRAGVAFRLATNVVEIAREGEAIVVTTTGDDGVRRIAARRLALATGVRETPRAARLVSGERPLGVLTTGALQAFVYLHGIAPFRRPVVVGTELVALSSLLTCRKIGAAPVAMVEEQAGPQCFPLFMALPRLLGVPLHYGAKVVDIAGSPRVRRATLAHADGASSEVACDGVLFTGRFTPEASLARAAGLTMDLERGRPVLDAFGRSSDPRIFAACVLDRSVETAGWCWSRGRAIADHIAADLAGRLAAP
ncbi:FAD-dependent oxidoreductase [Methylopila sp. 73B]|uniref:NAD(P)/FAD-dependent oxidoreductase n=1 Tax=Methylopila sp. 73B TaxID=1120792 RepID=UPI00036E6284|nr:FAD-dependent oxidoreductase [Methylopila sp. 73B]